MIFSGYASIVFIVFIISYFGFFSRILFTKAFYSSKGTHAKFAEFSADLKTNKKLPTLIRFFGFHVKRIILPILILTTDFLD